MQIEIVELRTQISVQQVLKFKFSLHILVSLLPTQISTTGSFPGLSNKLSSYLEGSSFSLSRTAPLDISLLQSNPTLSSSASFCPLRSCCYCEESLCYHLKNKNWSNCPSFLVSLHPQNASLYEVFGRSKERLRISFTLSSPTYCLPFLSKTAFSTTFRSSCSLTNSFVEHFQS